MWRHTPILTTIYTPLHTTWVNCLLLMFHRRTIVKVFCDSLMIFESIIAQFPNHRVCLPKVSRGFSLPCVPLSCIYVPFGFCCHGWISWVREKWWGGSVLLNWHLIPMLLGVYTASESKENDKSKWGKIHPLGIPAILLPPKVPV